MRAVDCEPVVAAELASYALRDAEFGDARFVDAGPADCAPAAALAKERDRAPECVLFERHERRPDAVRWNPFCFAGMQPPEILRILQEVELPVS